MIPKIIHYCWFGKGEKSKQAKNCIASWKKYFPDFEIREWNEDNCDYLSIPFMAEAYQEKKYAFVSDVMRLIVLEQYGGIYFDTDVEVIRDFSPLLQDEGVIGFENDEFVNTGQVLISAPHHKVIQSMIEEYKRIHFILPDGTLNAVGCPQLNTDVMKQFGLICNGREQLVEGIHIYPSEYFNPLDSSTRQLNVTANTYSIHWYSQSWLPGSVRLRCKITTACRKVFGKKCFEWLKKHK